LIEHVLGHILFDEVVQGPRVLEPGCAVTDYLTIANWLAGNSKAAGTNFHAVFQTANSGYERVTKANSPTERTNTAAGPKCPNL